MSECDPFYVGYLPLPRSIKRFIVPWLVGNVVLAIGIAAVVAQQHREPGDGVWETGEAVAIEGFLINDPYPILFVWNTPYILVEQGKVGSQERVGKFLGDRTDGMHVYVNGYMIQRDGRHVIEIDGTHENPIAPSGSLYGLVEDGENIWREKLDLGTHTLRGEIVDPKCLLGVMQPGDGKTHKVCATLCIKGGIPPMLLVKNDAGQTAAYLLTDAEGKAFPESHHEYIADPIQVTGQVLRDGDLLILRADLGSIQRLGARASE